MREKFAIGGIRNFIYMIYEIEYPVCNLLRAPFGSSIIAVGKKDSPGSDI